ncbi:hypothetical protein V8G54_029351 [Vigna mungo]|uniref:T-complex protein 1 subunit gamma n=1 Tax=Vigna mungo TaxID=3915 RepID=A0AAQ3MUG7_VIGMU
MASTVVILVCVGDVEDEVWAAPSGVGGVVSDTLGRRKERFLFLTTRSYRLQAPEHAVAGSKDSLKGESGSKAQHANIHAAKLPVDVPEKLPYLGWFPVVAHFYPTSSQIFQSYNLRFVITEILSTYCPLRGGSCLSLNFILLKRLSWSYSEVFSEFVKGHAVANIIRTTLGPRSMLKMLLDAAGGIVVTNDGNAILHEIDLAHPAAKSMIELSRTQDEEVGDGTTSVIILAGEMLHVAEALIDKSYHPTVICRAYNKALEDAIAVLDRIAMPIDAKDRAEEDDILSYSKRYAEIYIELRLFNNVPHSFRL